MSKTRYTRFPARGNGIQIGVSALRVSIARLGEREKCALGDTISRRRRSESEAVSRPFVRQLSNLLNGFTNLCHHCIHSSPFSALIRCTMRTVFVFEIIKQTSVATKRNAKPFPIENVLECTLSAQQNRRSRTGARKEKEGKQKTVTQKGFLSENNERVCLCFKFH